MDLKINKIFDKMDKILERKKQIILYGVPGVGKTYLAKRFVNNYNRRPYKKLQYLNNSQSDKDLSNLNIDAGTKAHILRDICYLISDGISDIDNIINTMKNKISDETYWKAYALRSKKENAIKYSLEKGKELNLIDETNGVLTLTEKGNELVNSLDKNELFTYNLSKNIKKIFFNLVDCKELREALNILKEHGKMRFYKPLCDITNKAMYCGEGYCEKYKNCDNPESHIKETSLWYELRKKGLRDDLLFWTSGITPIQLTGKYPIFGGYECHYNNEFFKEIGINKENESKLGIKTKSTKLNEDIHFKLITFHQAFAYEEFIEGLRPKNENEKINYKIEDGIFKKMCISAIWEALNNNYNCINNENNYKYIDFENVNFYSCRLGETRAKEVYVYAIKENVIGISFDDNIDYTDCNTIDDIIKKIEENKKTTTSYHIMCIEYIRFKMKNGDIILVPHGDGSKVKAIGRINGDYIYKKHSPFKKYNFHQFRKVEWLWIAKNESEYIDVNEIRNDGRNFGRHTIVELNGRVNIGFLKNFLKNKTKENITNETENKKLVKENLQNYEEIKQEVIQKLTEYEKSKNIFKEEDFQNAPKYYLIIDEINRGNISNILGELITLLEKDKRLGENNEILIDLPYSKESFAVPPNLYIIGTMNTADKSIALLDTALRRRFGFLEIEPNYDLIDKEIEGIKLNELLETINTKITLLKDRDHRIGHSYFLNIKTVDDLRFVWYNEIIPLLMEYFYNDWESLKEILKGFVNEKKPNIKINYDLINNDLKLYEIKEYEGEEFIKALNSVIT